jgi:hypothetical protein
MITEAFALFQSKQDEFSARQPYNSRPLEQSQNSRVFLRGHDTSSSLHVLFRCSADTRYEMAVRRFDYLTRKWDVQATSRDETHVPRGNTVNKDMRYIVGSV